MDITPEMIAALAKLRAVAKYSLDMQAAFNVLDNSGIFAAIDEATGYDTDPEPERVSKCDCLPGYAVDGYHTPGCPGDPAEWGDLAYTSKVPGWSRAVEAQRKMNAARKN
jgi:hypothetical protein